MNLIKYRNWFFALSLLIIIPGIVALFIWGLKLGVDFEGGTLWEIKFPKTVTTQELQNFLKSQDAQVSALTTTSSGNLLIRLKITEETKITKIKTKLQETYGPTEDARLETVGGTISRELTQKALAAVGISILAIVTYITWAFRKVSKPTSAVAFGICTIIALVHDVIVVVGSFAILGHFLNLEVDSLFITALLTVLGFSVHDTIVVFDRIRENLGKYEEYSFDQVVNHSLLQTLARSTNTSLTVVFVLLALLLFGGQSIRGFVIALMIGIVSGTYSSIFNAAPLLVVWQKFTNSQK